MSLTTNNYYMYELANKFNKLYSRLDSPNKRFVKNIVNVSYQAGYQKAREDYLEMIRDQNNPKINWDEDDEKFEEEY